MNWIKKIKEVLTLFAITILIYGICDFVLGQYLNDGVAYMCRDESLHHKYCPQSKRTYKMAEIDGGAVIDSYWNRDSIRVKNKDEIQSNTDFHQYRNILIGDSFIAQRQVGFEERISSILNQRLGLKTAIQFGTGSWNMVTYSQAVKHIKPRKGQNIHIFLMSNDFFSNGYGMSNARYYEPFKEIKPEDIFWEGNTETFNSKFNRWLSNNSFTYQFLIFKNVPKKPTGSKQDLPNLPLVELDEIQTDCELLENYRYIFKDKKTFSLVEHAFDISCYDEKALENLYVLKNLDIYLTQIALDNGFSIFYYFIPTGTFRSDEGKEFKIAKGLNENSSITSEGIRSAIEYTLSKPIFSFEKIFKEHSDELLYFSYDGHWNATGSAVVAEELSKFMSK